MKELITNPAEIELRENMTVEELRTALRTAIVAINHIEDFLPHVDHSAMRDANAFDVPGPFFIYDREKWNFKRLIDGVYSDAWPFALPFVNQKPGGVWDGSGALPRVDESVKTLSPGLGSKK